MAEVSATSVPLYVSAPFAVLLILIAVMPLGSVRMREWWAESYAFVSLGIAAAVALYYAILVRGGVVTIGNTARDYVAFISLIGSLFVVCGGIHVRVRAAATPLANTSFLLLGATLSNIMGTTGASMVLIRPWIEMNRARPKPYHIIFFIFIIANIGGALTPVGDPPLFLGYLKGVPFFWLARHVSLQWIFTLAMVLSVFYVFERFALRSAKLTNEKAAEGRAGWSIAGAKNLFFVAVIIAAVFLPQRHFIRESVMIVAAVVSYATTSQRIRTDNQFSSAALKEVAVLFVGIFVTMTPALTYIDQHRGDLRLNRPIQYYLTAGALSSVLDNAPTYATFIRIAEGAAENGVANGQTEKALIKQLIDSRDKRNLVIAVSLGSVFFGAMTYIGNGPNFMIKSIADCSGIPVPSFFGYIGRYSIPVLFPILLISGLVFL